MEKTHCVVPVSVGELYDKYTILQIKNERIKDADKQVALNKELNYLKKIINNYNLDSEIIKELKDINEKLWDIEDNIRIKDKKNEFDNEFINLAKSVYITNDARCVVKNKINKILKSELSEVKSYVQNVSDINNAPDVENPTDINKYYLELGAKYESENKFNEAITQCYFKIIQKDKNNGVILNQIGVCYTNMEQYELAIEFFKKVLAIKEIDDVCCNIGICYTNIKDYKSAEKYFLKANKINNKKGAVMLVQIYYYLKDYNKSIEMFNKIDNKISNYHVQQYNVSFTYLSKCDFKKGFEMYENRLKITNVNNQNNTMHCRAEVPIKYWNGIDKCDRLLIIYEQGIGDNIMFYRFIIQLANLYPDMKITYFCKKEVKNIFKTFDNIDIVTEISVFNYDYKLYIMSLPYILKLNYINVNEINYINVNENKVCFWKEHTSHLKKFKVGFVYNGLLTSFIQKNIPLEEFKILADMDIDLICIHRKNEVLTDIEKIGWKDKINYYDIDTDEPFEDTIALLNTIDLLITVDTFIVHLAGILNVKTWLLLGKYSEWRWSDKETNHWYESVELIRMTEDSELKNIMSKVKTKLMSCLVWFGVNQIKRLTHN
jgi:tetratricopeptide (TPR) repeat protein